MFGIASNQGIDISSIAETITAHGYRDGKDVHIFYNPWMAVCGRDRFENTSIVVVSDSDIYNSEELVKLVNSEPRSEAHLVSLLYIKYGLLAFEKLRGYFSLCIIDKINQKLVVVTDRFGIKPLVYYTNGRHFIFGQRIKAILSSPQSKVEEIDYEAVSDYINFSAIPTPKTIYKEIRKLPPGHFLTIKREKMLPKIGKYYDIEYTEEKINEGYFLRKLPSYIEESVRSILEIEVSKGKGIGAFLSGGTDSSTVVGMIKKLNGHVKTFSIGFDEPGYNELKYARITSKYFSSEHYEYIVTPDDVLKALDIILDVYDEPFGNASSVPTYYCALLAKEHRVDTLLAGDGGDEIFGGNERYATHNIFSRYHKIPLFLRQGFVEPLLQLSPLFFPLIGKGKKYIKRANIPQPDRFFSYNPVSALGKEAIFSSDLLRHLNGYDSLAWARELYKSVRAGSELNKLLYIDMKFTITDNDIRKVITMSERAGVKVCFPLLDPQLVDFAGTIPASLKVRGTNLRYFFKKALKDFLPIEVLKKKKHGFGLPIGIWLRTNDKLSSFAKETLLASECTIRPFFREGFIEEIFRLHITTGATFYGDIIWLLLMLELWNKKVRTSKTLCQ